MIDSNKPGDLIRLNRQGINFYHMPCQIGVSPMFQLPTDSLMIFVENILAGNRPGSYFIHPTHGMIYCPSVYVEDVVFFSKIG